jgi:hypothetical protein
MITLTGVLNQVGDVLIVLLMLGGRYERALALALAVRVIGLTPVYLFGHWDHPGGWLVIDSLHLLVLIVSVWIARRYRPVWLLTYAILSTATLALYLVFTFDYATPTGQDLFSRLHWLNHLITAAKLLCLAAALPRRWLSPPAPLPPAGRDQDLLEAARA